MELWKYSGKLVKITTDDNQVFIGKAYDFTPAQDNVPKISSISIDCFELYENEIRSIEEL